MRRYPLLIILGVTEVFIFLLLARMAFEENCDNNTPRWECSTTLESMLEVALWVVPALALVYVGPDLWPWLTSTVGRLGRWIVIGLALALVARILGPDTGTTYDWVAVVALWAFMAAGLGLLVAHLVRARR